jgi:uncharacterized protein YcgI (DUF1989 family)
MQPERHIVAASHGRAFSVDAGALVAIATPTGTQVADFWAFARVDPREHLSMEHTRSINSNIFVDTGTRLVSNLRRPMLTVIADTSPGRHDTVLCPCNAAIYRELGVHGYHRSCTDNLHEALGALSLDVVFAPGSLDVAFTPGSLNLFMNIPVAADGRIDRLPPHAAPGDAVTMRAEMDLVVVVSACPQDITIINGADRRPSEIHVTIASRAGE